MCELLNLSILSFCIVQSEECCHISEEWGAFLEMWVALKITCNVMLKLTLFEVKYAFNSLDGVGQSQSLSHT